MYHKYNLFIIIYNQIYIFQTYNLQYKKPKSKIQSMFLKRLIFIIFSAVMLIPNVTLAKSSDSTTSTKEITMSSLDAIKLAGALVDKDEFDNAEIILTGIPVLNNPALEIERWFLLGQISAREGDYDTAIKIFRKILDAQPDLARIRFELAICYIKTKQWGHADYNLRLAMAAPDLSNEVKAMMNYYRYFIRQNKNWNIWFNFGAAPDTNINNANGGQECVMTAFGLMCRQLVNPESAIGYNFILGGNYEFELSEHWRWKSEGNIYTNIYDIHDYDDLYLTAGTGARYIWSKGDVWLAPTIGRRWYGWDRYNWFYGLRLDTNYDITRKLSSGLYLRYTKNEYDLYKDILSGDTYSANGRLSYYINSRLYSLLRFGATRENTINKSYSYWQPNVSIGLGAELPWGFHVYIEPAFYWTIYDNQQWVVKNGNFEESSVHDFIQRYSLSISTSKIDFYGFIPTVILNYTRRDSNIWQREYNKWSIELTMQQRF